MSHKNLLLISFLVGLFLTACHSNSSPTHTKEHQTAENKRLEKDEYDEQLERYKQEFEDTKDPALGYVPIERLWNAIN